jgi:hypothetical protein
MSLWKRLKQVLLYEFTERVNIAVRIAATVALFLCVLAVFYAIWHGFLVNLEIAHRELMVPKP